MAEPASPTPAGGADAAGRKPEAGRRRKRRRRPRRRRDADADAGDGAAPHRRGVRAHGIAVEALEALLEEVGADATTSDVCHAVVKPATTPAGWWTSRRSSTRRGAGTPTATAAPTRRAPPPTRRPRRSTSAPPASTPPPGTRSYCALLRARPATAHLVGAPTLFLSHAWLYRFAEVVAALRAFVDALPRGAPPQFVWFDCFSIDEHATQALPQDWWATTFGEAIARIGHTVMVLAPWDAPTPLPRAWCLWELHCPARAPGARFSVALGPAQRRAFEEALLADDMALLDAFARIDVRRAQAGDPRDRAMILGVVEAAAARRRSMRWRWGSCAAGRWARRGAGGAAGGDAGGEAQVGNLLIRFHCNAEAEALFREVVPRRRAAARMYRPRSKSAAPAPAARHGGVDGGGGGVSARW